MSNSKPLSIYLLREGYGPDNAIEDMSKVRSVATKAVSGDPLPLFIKKDRPKSVWWKEYLGLNSITLTQVLRSAVLILEAGTRNFAICFGHGHTLLDSNSYQYDFGLRVTLNAVDPRKLKIADIVNPSDALKQRIQVPVASELTYFHIDNDESLIRRLSGTVSAKYHDLFQNTSGTSNLRITTKIPVNDIPSACDKLLALYKDTRYRKHFPSINKIVPVRDPLTVQSLEERLCQAIAKNSASLQISLPDIDDPDRPTMVKFRLPKKYEAYHSVTINDFIQHLQDQNVDLTTIKPVDLRKHKVYVVDENHEEMRHYSIRSCLTFDVRLSKKGTVFYLNEGEWYAVDAIFATTLKQYLDSHYTPLGLIDCEHKKEDDYIDEVKKKAKYISLHTKSISPKGQRSVEPCDVFSVENGIPTFYHIKRRDRAAQMSHHCMQAFASTSLLRSGDKEPVDLLIELLKEQKNKKFLSTCRKVVRHNRISKMRVRLGIITNIKSGKKSDKLTLLMQIALRAFIRELERWQVDVGYGFIQDVREG